MSRKDGFVKRCIDYCRDDSHGYSQTNDRFGHPDFYCSSLVYQCAIEAGYDLPTGGTRYTGTMPDHFRAVGFTAQPFDGNVHDLDPGDVVLNVANHVEMCVMPGCFGGAHIDERGNVAGGVPGDQTGNEVLICPASSTVTVGTGCYHRPQTKAARPPPRRRSRRNESGARGLRLRALFCRHVVSVTQLLGKPIRRNRFLVGLSARLHWCIGSASHGSFCSVLGAPFFIWEGLPWLASKVATT